LKCYDLLCAFDMSINLEDMMKYYLEVPIIPLIDKNCPYFQSFPRQMTVNASPCY
jgi:hypothetical protein